MSYALTFYKGSLDAIAGNFRTPTTQFYESLLPAWKRLYAGLPGEDTEATLMEALRTIFSSFDKSPEAGPLSVEAAIASGVMSQATELGSLAHSSAGGDLFRDEFLGVVAAEIVGEPRLTEYLTRRPLFGFRPKDYPGWGYLTTAELEKRAASPRPAPKITDSDLRAWLKDFEPMLEEVRNSQKDLLTVYR